MGHSRKEYLAAPTRGFDDDRGSHSWSSPGACSRAVCHHNRGVNLFFSTGVGLSVHFLNGSGPGIDGTFVEDLLDSVSAGFNLHAGLEYPISDRVRINGRSKIEVLGDLNYVEFGGGMTFLWGSLVQGEDR